MPTDAIKQSVLLVLALGGIVALIAPSDDPEPVHKPKPVAEQPVVVEDDTDEDDAYWDDEGEDDYEDEEEDFAFGEPMTSTDPETDIAPDITKSAKADAPAKISRSPSPNELGGKNNPIPSAVDVGRTVN